MYDDDIFYEDEYAEAIILGAEEWDRLMAMLDAEPKIIPALSELLKKQIKED
jgi:hypothetical protein